MLTRDSVIWWIGIVGGLVVYLSSTKPPTQWDYYQWLQFIGFGIATISGKLATSPLAGRPKDDRVDPSKLPLWLLILVLVPCVTACGPKTRPTLVKTDAAVYESIKALHQTAVVLGQSQMITPAQELQIQQAILPVSKLGESATRVIAAWKSGPTPPELQQLVREMGNLTQQIIAILPQNAQAKATLLEKVAVIQQAIATVLMIMGAAS